MASVEHKYQQAFDLRKRAKALLIFTLVTAAFCHNAQAQNFAEWFSQKKTQKKYLLQQIAALQLYSGYLQKGYRLAKGRLRSIGDHVGNEFGKHGHYYSYLNSVSPVVKKTPQIDQILRRQQLILQLVKKLEEQQGLSATEITYVTQVCKTLLDDCNGQVDDLQSIVAGQKTTMSDAERIRQIARVDQAMEDNYRFAASFRSQLQLYARSKKQEMKDVNTLKHLYATQ